MRFVAIAALAAVAVSLAGCAGTGGFDTGATLAVTGDQKGGKIPNGFNDVPAAMRSAQAHCAQYHKKAVVTQMNSASAGGLVVFECLN
jgi:hypothetical protein